MGRKWLIVRGRDRRQIPPSEGSRNGSGAAALAAALGRSPSPGSEDCNRAQPRPVAWGIHIQCRRPDGADETVRGIELETGGRIPHNLDPEKVMVVLTHQTAR